MILEDFQTTALIKINKIINVEKSVLLQSATASGKTVISCAFIKEQLVAKKKVLVLVNLQALVGQFYSTLNDFDIKASVLHDEITRDKQGNMYVQDWKNPIQITMPITLLNTINGKNQLKYNSKWKPDVIVIDEAHKGTSLNFQLLRDLYPDAKIVGLTATPYREKNAEGEQLIEWYGDRLVTTCSVRELINKKRLVQPYYYDFAEDTHLVNTWLKYADGKKTIIFTRNTLHSLAVQEAFKKHNIDSEIITAGSDLDPDNIITKQTPLQRQAIYDRFQKGKLNVLISVMALCEGFDCPEAQVCMLARTVGNHALYHQMVGRVLRAYMGKDYALILDFCGNIAIYGPVEDYEWSVEAVKIDCIYVKSKNTVSLETYNEVSNVYYTCRECAHIYDVKKQKICVHCKTESKVKVVSTVYEVMRKHFEIKNSKDLEMFKVRFKGALSMPVARKGFNLSVKKSVFDIENNVLAQEFSFLPKLLEKKVNGSDEIVIDFAA